MFFELGLQCTAKTENVKILTGCVELVFSAYEGSEERKMGEMNPKMKNSLRLRFTPRESEAAMVFPAVSSRTGVLAVCLIDSVMLA